MQRFPSGQGNTERLLSEAVAPNNQGPLIAYTYRANPRRSALPGSSEFVLVFLLILGDVRE
ncbi:hypothetical protein [Thalassoroseus pseudoceratinae]|uniref:hypothetical protein n=1 Tax=Thalassoroseus pseudoceratinae TaxID=2713176 RepID=UPI0014217CB2|nr:hypothetical protein [Thalassoroseus pseudoceratinae]